MMNGLLGLQAQKHCYGAGLWSSTIPAGRRALSWTGLKLCFSFWKAYGDNWLKDLVTCSHHHHGMAVAPSKGTGESHAVRLAARRAAKQYAKRCSCVMHGQGLWMPRPLSDPNYTPAAAR